MSLFSCPSIALRLPTNRPRKLLSSVSLDPARPLMVAVVMMLLVAVLAPCRSVLAEPYRGVAIAERYALLELASVTPITLEVSNVEDLGSGHEARASARESLLSLPELSILTAPVASFPGLSTARLSHAWALRLRPDAAPPWIEAATAAIGDGDLSWVRYRVSVTLDGLTTDYDAVAAFPAHRQPPPSADAFYEGWPCGDQQGPATQAATCEGQNQLSLGASFWVLDPVLTQIAMQPSFRVSAVRVEVSMGMGDGAAIGSELMEEPTAVFPGATVGAPPLHDTGSSGPD